MKSYFLTGDGVERKFDAGFFGVKPVEANVMDPQVRILLEATYEALENAGQTIESLQGSDTGCYVGLMLGEYEQASKLPSLFCAFHSLFHTSLYYSKSGFTNYDYQ